MLNPAVWKSNPDDSITQPLLFDVFRPGVLLLKAGSSSRQQFHMYQGLVNLSDT